MQSLHRTRSSTPPALALALFLSTVSAHAATLTPDCGASGDPLHCRLLNILHILYIAAGVLGVILILIATFAYFIYRRNRARRLLEDSNPEETQP